MVLKVSSFEKSLKIQYFLFSSYKIKMLSLVLIPYDVKVKLGKND